MDNITNNLYQYLYEESYFSSGPWAQPFLASLSSRISHKLLGEVKNVAFIIIKPDAIRAGKLKRVISYLRNNGIEPIEAIQLCMPKLKQFEELYKFN